MPVSDPCAASRWKLVASAFTLLALTACGEKPAPAPAPTSASAPAPSTAPAAPIAAAPKAAPKPPAQTESKKLNAYVDCYNRVDKRAHEAMNRYRQWVKNMDTGPTGKERVVYGVYTVSESSVRDCVKLAEQADDAPALPGIDPTVKVYANAVAAWTQTLEEADKYYNREDYKDDQMAKGKALHPELVKRYEAFSAASEAFSQALDVANDKRQAEQLVELEKSEGRKFNYWHISTMVTAKKLVKLVTKDGFDLEQATAALKSYEDAAQGLSDFTKNAAKDELPMMHSSLDNNAESTLVAAKQLIRRVRDKVPYSRGEQMNLSGGSGWMVEGSPDALIRHYNELIAASNRLR